jgi:hypothetical protein
MRAVMMSLALLAGLILPLDEAAGQTNCEKSCKGNRACVSRCGNAPKRSPGAKQGQAVPRAAVSGSQNGWRDRAFTSEGGAGGY